MTTHLLSDRKKREILRHKKEIYSTYIETIFNEPTAC